MAPPRGKAIYARDPRWYPQGNPAAYAAALGCSFIGLNHFASRDQHLQQAADVGLDVLLWSHPNSWEPGRWAATLDAMAERVYRFDLQGLIADPEGGWRGQADQRQLLSEHLGVAAQGLPSVGVTSFPSWYVDDLWAAASMGVWGSPQLYGIASPFHSGNEILRRRQMWVDVFGDNLAVSVAAWNRTPIDTPGAKGWKAGVWPQDQASYLSFFDAEQGALLWQVPTSKDALGRIEPWPGTEGFEILRRWQPAGAFELRPQTPLAAFIDKVVHPFPRLRRG